MKIFKKEISTDEAILLFAAGTFGVALIVGGVLIYGLDKIF